MEKVIIPEPCFVCYEPITTLSGGVPVHVPCRQEDEFRLRPEALKAAITPKTKLLIMPFPNNPTGAVYDEKVIREMGDIAAEYDIPLISDEIYDKIIMEGTHFSASQLPDDIPRVIFNGFSKVNLMPGWRMG